MQQADIMKVRRAVDANVGRRVRVKANRGRHRFVISEGVITDVYPSIFTVMLTAEDQSAQRVVSYSYKDVLTKDVQLVLCN